MLKMLNKVNQTVLLVMEVVQLAKLVSKMTKTPKDDLVVDKVEAVVSHLTKPVPQ
jgi:hypothetical protein